jgi:hypothetical protein
MCGKQTSTVAFMYLTAALVIHLLSQNNHDINTELGLIMRDNMLDIIVFKLTKTNC